MSNTEQTRRGDNPGKAEEYRQLVLGLGHNGKNMETTIVFRVQGLGFKVWGLGFGV